MDRSKKQPIFENIPKQSGELSQDAFFHPKEVKAQADFTRKIISSKMTGVLLSQAEVWLCYNMQTAVSKWFETVENRADILIQSILRSKQLCFFHPFGYETINPAAAGTFRSACGDRILPICPLSSAEGNPVRHRAKKACALSRFVNIIPYVMPFLQKSPAIIILFAYGCRTEI